MDSVTERLEKRIARLVEEIELLGPYCESEPKIRRERERLVAKLVATSKILMAHRQMPLGLREVKRG